MAALVEWTKGADEEAKTFNAKTAVNSSTNTITSNSHGFVDNEMEVYSNMDVSYKHLTLTTNREV